MNYSKRMKKNIKKMAWLVFCGFCFGITPYIFYLADLERGFNGTGGEILVPFIPVLVYEISKSIKEFINEGNEVND